LASPTGFVTRYPADLQGIWVSDRKAAYETSLGDPSVSDEPYNPGRRLTCD